MNFKKAFTLAEVLITLGIIGIVAALTLPSLIQKHQKQVWVNQLKKSVSSIEQGFQLILANNEVDNLHDTEMWRKIDGYTLDQNFNLENIEFFEEFKKYFSVTNFNWTDFEYTVYRYDGYEDYYCQEISLPNGALIISLNLDANKTNYSGDITIDVNGYKKPNTYGRDVFAFALLNNGHLIPAGSLEYANLYNRPDFYWKNNPESCGTPNNSTLSNNVDGSGCAARIIHDGWKMNY